MRTKDFLALEKAYTLVRESRAAGPESQAAGESAKALAIEKTLIKAITEDLNATAAHLQSIQPLIGTFEQGHMGDDFQNLLNALQSVQTAVEELQGRMPGDENGMGSGEEDFPEHEPMDEPSPEGDLSSF